MEKEINKKEHEVDGEDYEEEFSDQENEEDEDENTVPEFESQLGNKEYWDKFYSQEIKQFKNNADLIGEVWFGEQVQNKVVNYIKEKFTDKNTSILDVGCGNAAFLLKLAKLNFNNLNGMDYSQKSIELAQEILKEKIPDCYEMVKLYSEDINNPDKENKFSLIHDKGTMDAFLSLKDHKVSDYIKFILNNCCNDSTFILTSCNFSLPELNSMFLFEGSNFQFVENIPHKAFAFGGGAGQVVTTMVFTVKK